MSTPALIISEETARMAAALLAAIVRGEFEEEDHRVVNQRRQAATELIRLHMTEVRQRDQGEDHDANAHRPALTLLKGRAMSDLSEDELAELREQMTADFPGRTKPS
jgi:hypothetical protein